MIMYNMLILIINIFTFFVFFYERFCKILFFYIFSIKILQIQKSAQ